MYGGSFCPSRPLPDTRRGSAALPVCCAHSPPGRRPPPAPREDPTPRPFGVAVRSMNDGVQTFLEIANDSPYPLRLASVLDAPASAFVEDVGRGLRLSPVPEGGGRNLVLDLVPYGVAAIRIGSARAGSRSLR